MNIDNYYKLHVFCQILDEGIQDIRILQGELRSAIEEDFARSNESSSPGAALVYFQVGTMLGDPDSTFNLALCHHFGRGVKQDMKKVGNWLYSFILKWEDW